ncbi:protein-glutamate O-methyltransferase CheR [Desulfosporosinus fructosivorans]|uniref:Protein-glutamate O-methyltransferase CheR n=1 Tax=Desulfosporosinus fructosivorans TaxID=2018669 RepID=A0A4Z0R913_9FIRM|nr:protein-glutamate O-methyltransferase CheR [Desulfosporosinus fructosivorans]TGE38944.1 protein-glutamate O-methyltransferase CheR [Desulfosporosinus fructosivorans]
MGTEENGESSEVESCSELEKIEIHLLLEGIYSYYGYDFRNYVSASIRRRIWYRIRAERIQNVSSLQEKVLHDPSAMARLLSDFSIHVSEMFRDPRFFESFRKNVVPLLKELPFVRIWHAGCSTGEEVYSMAIILYEEGLYNKTKIYATDMNEDLLKKAKEGVYSLDKMRTYMDNYQTAGGLNEFRKYFEVSNDKVIFHPFLTQNVIFAQHNLAIDHSFNEFHVIICRNVMIYFDKVLQNRVHGLFYESLCPSGILGLGDKEDIAYNHYSHYYKAFDHEQKIYQKVKLLDSLDTITG